MSRTKIAPTLRGVAEECIRHVYGDEAGDAAAAELRAVVAVARTTRRMLDGGNYRMPYEAWGEIIDADARLRRVSGGAVKGNRKLPANSRRASPGGAEGGGR